MNLPGTFVEGFDAVRQPCTLPLLLSALVFVVAAGRAAPISAVAHLAGLTVMAWARFARIFTADLDGANAVIAGLLVAAAVTLVAWYRDRSRATVVAGAAVGGAVAAWAWRPCVGPRLADIINGAPDDRLGALLPTLAYTSGIALVSLALVALPIAVPRIADVMYRPVVVGIGAAMGLTLGVLMAIGAWDSIVDELLRRSTV